MPDRRWIIEPGDATFDGEVLARSASTPVVVDFWAPWCEPCKTLTPLLERLVTEHDGAFILAEVNVDEAPGLAAQFAVQSVPAVKGFRGGAVIAEFIGAQPESVVREFLATLLPSDADRLFQDAADLRGDEATARLEHILSIDGRHGGTLLRLAQLRSEHGEDAEALALLARMLPSSPEAAEALRLAAILRTRLEGTGDERELRERVDANPTDLAARLDLGRTLAARGRYEAALEALLAVVEADRSFADEAARKAMVDIFEVLGPQDMLTQRFQGQLARALFA